MPGDNVIQFVPKPNPSRPTLVEEAEKKAEEFLNAAPEMIPYGGKGIDGMDLGPAKS